MRIKPRSAPLITVGLAFLQDSVWATPRTTTVLDKQPGCSQPALGGEESLEMWM